MRYIGALLCDTGQAFGEVLTIVGLRSERCLHLHCTCVLLIQVQQGIKAFALTGLIAKAQAQVRPVAEVGRRCSCSRCHPRRVPDHGLQEGLTP